MKTKIHLMQDQPDIEEFWPISDFMNAYNTGIGGCSVATLSSEPGSSDPGKTALITCATFI